TRCCPVRRGRVYGGDGRRGGMAAAQGAPPPARTRPGRGGAGPRGRPPDPGGPAAGAVGAAPARSAGGGGRAGPAGAAGGGGGAPGGGGGGGGGGARRGGRGGRPAGGARPRGIWMPWAGGWGGPGAAPPVAFPSGSARRCRALGWSPPLARSAACCRLLGRSR